MHDCGLGPHGMYSESTRSPWMHLMNTKQSMSLHSYKQYSSSSQKILNGNLQAQAGLTDTVSLAANEAGRHAITPGTPGIPSPT
jgi:hypothetical protein